MRLTSADELQIPVDSYVDFANLSTHGYISRIILAFLLLAFVMNARQKAAEDAVFDQTNLLPKRELLIVFAVLAGSLFICFVDQNGIGVALPTIGRELHAEATISWAGTSALIANTLFQVLYGRLSDLFGMPCGRTTLLISDRWQEEKLSICPR